MSGTESQQQRGKWIAVFTGAVSILIGLLYLGLITILDSRGPMRPPPPEALVGAAVVSSPLVGEDPPPVGALSQETPAVSDHDG